MPSNLPIIRKLPDFLVDQIKAGEVIERPSTLLKELLENAIDAGSTLIEIHIRNNALDLLSIKDNGHGIAAEQLELAFGRHATSKIENYRDLFQLDSYGFRGEALASIASISRLSCETRCAQDAQGQSIFFEGGVVVDRHQIKRDEIGTHLVVKDLFFNTPARLKFIRSQTSEKNQLRKLFNSFLLNWPKVEFHIRWDDKDKKIFPPVERPEERIQKLFSGEQFKSFSEEYEGYRLRGTISLEDKKGQSRHQFIFVNNRLVYDRGIHQMLLNLGVSGAYALFLNIPKDHIDVNVHPNKTVVKFERTAVVFGLIKACLEKEALVSSRKSVPPLPLTGSTASHSNSNTRRETTHIHQHFDAFFVEKKYGLMYLSQACYLLDLQKLFDSQVWPSMKRQHTPLEKSIPLLIADPLLVPVAPGEKQFFENLQWYGLEFERLNSETVILRSTPNWPTYIQTGKLGFHLLKLAQKFDSFEDHLDELDFTQFLDLQTQVLAENISNWSQSSPLPSFLYRLTTNDFQAFFTKEIHHQISPH